MATEQIKSIKASGGDYTSIINWEAQNLNCVAADIIAVAELYDGLVDISGTCAINGWTVDATRYIIVRDAPSNGSWTGKWNASAARREIGLGTVIALRVYEEFVRFERLQFYRAAGTATGTGYAITVENTGGACDVRVKDCIYRGSASTGGTEVFLRNIGAPTGSVISIWNCLAYNLGWNSGGLYSVIIHPNVSATMNVYSCIMHRAVASSSVCAILSAGGTLVVKNCYAANGTDAAYNGATLTNCASLDSASGSVGLRSVAYSTANFANVTAGSEDLSLVSGSALANSGSDTSGDSAPLNFTTDITGETRSGAWDVGAYNYSASVATPWLYASRPAAMIGGR